MDYTEDDIILWHDDERLEDAIGKVCYFGNSAREALYEANLDRCKGRLIRIDDDEFPFTTDVSDLSYVNKWQFIILKKETYRKYAPFDMAFEEERDIMRDRWVRQLGGTTEFVLSRFFLKDGEWKVDIGDGRGLTAEELFMHYKFLDTGGIVGKVVDEVLLEDE